MLLQKKNCICVICSFKGAETVIRYIGRVGYPLNVNAHIWFIKVQVHFLFLSYFLYLH